MFSRYPFFSLVALFGLGASFACSAQGDQTDTGLPGDGNGNGGNGASNGGTLPLGGTSSTNGGASSGTIPISGTGSGAQGSGGTQGVICSGMGARLKGVLRDFQPNVHPDFEPQVRKPSAASFFNMVERGIVRNDIDPTTRKPIYAGGPTGTNTTIGSDYFPSWFIDTPNANLSIDYFLDFTESAPGSGLFVFDKSPFLPVDDPTPTNPDSCPPGALSPENKCLLGNSTNYNTHNYALTFEFHTQFIYKPGLSFLFAGDDDVWVFVNNQLAIDLGGVHQRAEGRLNLDDKGLTVGSTYILDFFWAERHVTQSNFRVETSLEFINCSIDVPK